MSDLLKKVIQGLINEDESSASDALHQYITNKTRQIAGLNEGAITSYYDDADDMFEANPEEVKWLKDTFVKHGAFITKMAEATSCTTAEVKKMENLWQGGYGHMTAFTGSFGPDDVGSKMVWIETVARTLINAARFYGVGEPYVEADPDPVD